MMLQHLKDPEQRKKIKAYLTSKEVDYASIMVASTSMSLNVAGKTIGEIAARQETDCEEAIMNIVERGGSEILVFEKNLSSEQVELLMAHSLSMIATDGAGFPMQGSTRQMAHPRCFGSMPKFLELVLKTSICSLEEAIKKMTSTPAEKVGLKKRGRIAVDYYADLVIFDEKVGSRADYKNPYQSPTGIDYVFVNGSASVEKGKTIGSMKGRILKKA
jgi:N-acyl-D-aspartate/D-glutamate deacylase